MEERFKDAWKQTNFQQTAIILFISCSKKIVSQRIAIMGNYT